MCEGACDSSSEIYPTKRYRPTGPLYYVEMDLLKKFNPSGIVHTNMLMINDFFTKIAQSTPVKHHEANPDI